MDNYLLSIVIPTKNRYKYLRECIQTLVQIESNKFEIVIQDNSDNNKEILEYLYSLHSEKIHYFYESRRLSQTENSDLAVSNTRGDYVCYIGDDDSVSSFLITLVNEMKNYSILACNVNATRYDWPDMEYKGKRRSVLSMDQRRLIVKKLITKDVLSRSLKSGLQEIEFLPKAYHAVISKKVLEQIKAETGSFFPGPSPDMANACGCAVIIDKHYYVRLPLIISGVGYGSANGMGRRGVHKGNLEDSTQLAPDIKEKWNKRIPKKWIGQAIWAESGIKSLEAMHRCDLVEKMNWYALYGRILLRFPEYRNDVFSLMYSFSDYICVAFNMLINGSQYLANKINVTIRILCRKQYETWNEMDLQNAVTLTNKFIGNKYNDDDLISLYSNYFNNN